MNNSDNSSVPEVLADPIAVIVDLVVAVEPALGRTVVEDVVAAVAGGRAKRRRLAQAWPSARSCSSRAAPRRRAGWAICSSRCAGRARCASPRRSVPVATSRCAPCSAAARTGSARSAGRVGNPAQAAGRPAR